MDTLEAIHTDCIRCICKLRHHVDNLENMLMVIDAALLFAGETAGTGIYPLAYVVVGKVEYAAGNSPGYEDFPRRVV